LVVWCGGREILWYQKAWSALEKEGLTSYDNSIKRTIVLIRVFTLIMIYQEFCDLAFEEHFYYEFCDWQEHSGLSAFRIGQIIGKVFKDIDFSEYDESEDFEALESAFLMLVENERVKVVDSLIKNSGEGAESTLFVSMYLTCVNMLDDEEEWLNEQEQEKSKLSTEELNDYEKYEEDIKKYYSLIVLSVGTYKVR